MAFHYRMTTRSPLFNILSIMKYTRTHYWQLTPKKQRKFSRGCFKEKSHTSFIRLHSHSVFDNVTGHGNVIKCNTCPLHLVPICQILHLKVTDLSACRYILIVTSCVYDCCIMILGDNDIICAHSVMKSQSIPTREITW